MKIFISSTYEDLKGLRRLVLDYFNQFPIEIEGMEVWGSSNKDPLDVCLEKVRESDIYIGIIGHRYGYVDGDSGKSITELEYIEAEKKGMDRFMFVMSDTYPIEPRFVDKGSSFNLLESFKKKILNMHYVSIFSNDIEFMEKLNLTFENFIREEKNLDSHDIESVWSSITEALKSSKYPDDLRVKLDNMRKTDEIITELESVINGIENAHKYIQESYDSQYNDLLKILNEFGISEDDLNSRFNYYENPFSGRDWEMITFFPNRIMNLRKIMFSIKLIFLIDKAMKNPWSVELKNELESAKNDFREFVINAYYID